MGPNTATVVVVLIARLITSAGSVTSEGMMEISKQLTFDPAGITIDGPTAKSKSSPSVDSESHHTVNSMCVLFTRKEGLYVCIYYEKSA